MPVVDVTGGECAVSSLSMDLAPDGCAIALVWFPVGARQSSWHHIEWMDRPKTWSLQALPDDEFGGVRYLVAVMVADAEVITVRVPAIVTTKPNRTYGLRELNQA